ncbi:MAG: butyrate kinase [Clostridiales bacterium]|nr:butyrate kinase [Clostridiales bacterium]
MDQVYRLLAINPGSTSTKIAVFENEEKVFQDNIEHSPGDLAAFKKLPEQMPFRHGVIENAIKKAGYGVEDFDAFVGRGGSLKPCEGGTYEVGGALLEDARDCIITPHPAALGSVLAYGFAQAKGVRAFTVDPPDVDEFEPIARISGIKSIPRESRSHALNQKEAARRAAKDLGKTYGEASLIVAHIGGGVSVGAHKAGRLIDATNLAYGEGPMAPTRCGTIPVLRVVGMMEQGFSPDEIKDYVLKTGGVLDHLGTADMREVDRMVQGGDEYARLVREALVYHISKSIGALSAVLCGKADAIVLTGGVVNSRYISDGIKGRVGFIAPVLVYPGEFEMEALANGALRVLRGEEAVKIYGEETVKICGEEAVKIFGEETVKICGEEAVKICGEEAVKIGR